MLCVRSSKYWVLSGRSITQSEVRERAKKSLLQIRIYFSLSSNSEQEFIYVSAVVVTSTTL